LRRHPVYMHEALMHMHGDLVLIREALMHMHGDLVLIREALMHMHGDLVLMREALMHMRRGSAYIRRILTFIVFIYNYQIANKSYMESIYEPKKKCYRNTK
jgi:hypothetical protein